MNTEKPSTNHQISVSQLNCLRGDRLLISDLSFELSSGELLYLKGHNGSGKTTLLRTLCGLLEAETGEICWNNQSIKKTRDLFHSELLYLGHLNGLKGDLTAVENLRIDAAIQGQALDEDAAWKILTDIGLNGHEDIPCKYLSQGQKRRVALARLWVSQKSLWVLDEPFSALDSPAVEQLQQIIQQHISKGGMVILTTHQEVTLTKGEAKVLVLGKPHA